MSWVRKLVFVPSEMACEEYFRVKSITDTKQVESILARLQDFHIADWVRANAVDLKTLSFSEFMERLREETLEEDWDRAIMLEIHDSKQRKRPFPEWVYHLQNRNALLRGRKDYHYDETSLRLTLEKNMAVDLEERVRRLEIPRTSRFKDWVEKVKKEDKVRLRDDEKAEKRLLEMAKKMHKNDQRPPTEVKKNAYPARTTLAPRNMNSKTLPKLTADERAIILNHQGCFKCRRLYVDHVGVNCPNNFPPAESYKPLTVEHAEAVRDSKNKPKGRENGTGSARAGPSRPVAHLAYMEEETGETWSAVLGTGEEESDENDRYVSSCDEPPLHLDIWNGAVRSTAHPCLSLSP